MIEAVSVGAGRERAARPTVRSRRRAEIRRCAGNREAPPRWLGALLASAVLLVACGAEPVPEPAAEPTPPAAVEAPRVPREVEPAPEPLPVTEPRGMPVRVVVPVIDVDADLVELGLAADRSMEVPEFGLAGWYTEGPAPGRAGPSVVAAHVDSRSGPDVFYRLRELEPGDEVTVVYDTGDEAHFRVDRSERTPKDELPVDAIWPVTAEPLLALLTCGGAFDRSVRHYLDNVVVYALPDADAPVTLATT